jgi:allantoate deiminase
LEVFPNASNVIPGEVVANLDVRHEKDGSREAAVLELLDLAKAVASSRNVDVVEPGGSDHATVAMDQRLQKMLAEAIGEDALTLVSGAGHDAAILAPVVPSAMLFIRSPSGVSHHPEERVYAADVEAALLSIVRFVERLAHEYNPSERTPQGKE